MNPTLEQFFSKKILEPLHEWQKEADTNKAFYLGDKSFEYLTTIAGHEPVIEFPDDRH